MRALIVTGLAALCGISAVVGANRWRSQQVPGQAAVETVEVVVAAAEIAPFEQLTPELLGLKKWPKAHVPAGSVQSVDEILNWYSMGRILPGEPLIREKLSNQPLGIGSKISAGMRAISVLTPKYSSSVAGLIMPGHHVDVLLTRKSSGGRTGGGFAETLLQNVMVLAVDRQIRPETPGEGQQRGAKQVQSVTLEVTPPQAERLSSAQLEGEILLVLRGANDHEEVEIPEPKPEPDQMSAKVLAMLANMQDRLAEMEEPKPQPAVATKPEPIEPLPAEELKPIDIPVYTLRGSQWGYVMARQPVPRVPIARSDR